MKLYKGIFWYVPAERRLIAVKVACDQNGTALTAVEYSSESGDNFNHKSEWAKMPESVTYGKPYNYFPRGRVEVKNGKAAIYFNPALSRLRLNLCCKCFDKVMDWILPQCRINPLSE